MAEGPRHVGPVPIPFLPEYPTRRRLDLPKALLLLVVCLAVVWIPLKRSQDLGLSIYAIGSNELAAFRSGVPWRAPRSSAYALRPACSPPWAVSRSP